MNGLTLVTGGAGFVGKRLVEKLRARGERVRSFDLSAPVHADDIQGSITDAGEVAAAMQSVDTVFHLAGNAQLWARDNAVFEQVNHYGAKTVAKTALRAGVRKFVHCSSLTTLVARQTQIGPSKADEEMSFAPADMLGAYPRSKLRAESAVLRAAEEGLNAVIALPTEPLGPGDDSLTPPTKMILDFANGKTPAYIDCILNFVPVDSLADGLIAARDKGRKGERYLLGGENVSLSRLLVMIGEATGRPMPKAKLPYWVALAAGAIDTGLVAQLTGKPPAAPLTGVRLAGRQVSFSSEKAARELGWRAGDVAPALARTIAWLRTAQLLKTVSNS